MLRALTCAAFAALTAGAAAAADWKDQPVIKALYEKAKPEGRIMV